MKRLPWEPWWWKDWFSDSDLMGCSIAARGAWHDLLGRMWQQDDVDYQITKTYVELARFWATTEDGARTLVDELENAHVADFVREDALRVTVLSRRRNRTANERKSNAARQMQFRRRHSNGKVTAPVTPMSHESNGDTTDVRQQTPDSTNPILSSPQAAPTSEKVPLKQCIEAFFQAFKAKHGQPYHVEKKDAAQVKRLLVWLQGQGMDPEATFKQHLGAFLDDEFVVEKKAATLAYYCQWINKAFQKGAPKAPGKRQLTLSEIEARRTDSGT